jgi:hypothetical protein
VKKHSFELLELEMADLKHFWRKKPLGPLGVKRNKTIKNCFASADQAIEEMHSYGFPKDIGIKSKRNGKNRGL